MGLMREPWLEATMVILRLAFGLILILSGASCATQPRQPPHPYMTNDFVIMLDPYNCETKGEITKCTLKFYIPGGTKHHYALWNHYEDPGQISVYLEDAAIYNQQNVHYQAINLNGSAIKPSCSGWSSFSRVCRSRLDVGWLKHRDAPYINAREYNASNRLLDLYFKHPSDFKPEFLDVRVFWRNLWWNESLYYDSDYNSYAGYDLNSEDLTFKFKIGTSFGWRPEIANPNDLKEVEGRVFRRLSPEGR
jgi:hypothetical protein